MSVITNIASEILNNAVKDYSDIGYNRREINATGYKLIEAGHDEVGNYLVQLATGTVGPERAAEMLAKLPQVAAC